MEIEIKECSENSEDKFEVLYKNERIGHADFNFDGKEMFGLQIDEGNSEKFFPYSTGDLCEIKTNYLALPINQSDFPLLDWLGQYSVVVIDANKTLSIYIRPNFLEWDKSISIKEFLFQLQHKISLNDKIDSDLEKQLEKISDELDFSIELLNIIGTGNIGFLYQKTLKLLENITREIFLELDIEKNEKSFTSIFRFPPEIQTTCEQYLIYFSKFLEDLGIEAETSIESNSLNTLFKVTPKNSKEALLYIRDALNIYLNLPNASNIEDISKSYSDIGVQQLIANIYHLKSQLILANSTIDLKNATIEGLKFSNYQMKNILEKSNENSNQETTLDGIVTIDQFEYKGLKINLAELFRRIKRRLK